MGLMMESVTKIDWSNLRQAIPSFVSIVIMPFTYSIAYGILGGLITHFLIVWINWTLDFIHSKCPLCQKWEICKPDDGKRESRGHSRVLNPTTQDALKTQNVMMESSP